MSLVEVLVRPSTRSNRTPPVIATVCEDRDCCTLVLSFLFCWGVVGGCKAVPWDVLLVVWGAGGGGLAQRLRDAGVNASTLALHQRVRALLTGV